MSRSIAIVEDDPDQRENYADALTRHGFEVKTYSSRLEALEGFKSGLPDLAILDIMLGDEPDGGFDLCRELARAEAARLDTQNTYRKLAWLAHELSTLDLPPSLPKGICHCDFHFSNVLFQGEEFVALLDFDDANRTFLPFDLVGLVESWAWPDEAEALDLAEARRIVQAYGQHRPLSAAEQQHLYDVYKLSILFD